MAHTNVSFPEVGLLPGWETRLQPQEVLLVTFLIDDSTSVFARGNNRAIEDGFDDLRERLRGAPGDIRARVMFFNKRQQSAFVPATRLGSLRSTGYWGTGGTPLYRRTMEELRETLIESATLRAQGARARSMNFLFTDGEDSTSGNVLSEHVWETVRGMFKTGAHIVGGYGVSNGHTNFRAVFQEMGIPDNWIQVLRDREEVLSAFTDLGTTVISGIGEDSFTTTLRTGFGGRLRKPN